MFVLGSGNRSTKQVLHFGGLTQNSSSSLKSCLILVRGGLVCCHSTALCLRTWLSPRVLCMEPAKDGGRRGGCRHRAQRAHRAPCPRAPGQPSARTRQLVLPCRDLPVHVVEECIVLCRTLVLVTMFCFSEAQTEGLGPGPGLRPPPSASGGTGLCFPWPTRLPAARWAATQAVCSRCPNLRPDALSPSPAPPSHSVTIPRGALSLPNPAPPLLPLAAPTSAP